MVSGQVLWPRGVVLRSCPGDYIFGDGFRGQRDCSGLGFRGQGWFSAEASGPGRSFGMPGMALESGLGPRGCFWGQTYGFGRCFGDQRIVSGQVLHPGDGLGNGAWGPGNGFGMCGGEQRMVSGQTLGPRDGFARTVLGWVLELCWDCLEMVWDGFGIV